MQRYNPSELEPKWQKIWDEQRTYQVEADPGKQKSYVTAMFPYPSGAGLHVGHVRNYSITDAIARFQRAKGKNVLSTIGWDAFGLPAENYAIKTGTPPAEITKQNIVNFKSQLKRLGMSYDWSRELNTTDPSYYKWTQWLFLQLFKEGLAYQKESLQWWCPICKTVLANEQVINGGYCWRHEDTLVEKKWLKQWFFKITDYADELLEGLDDLNWPEKIKTMQRNWIGRSQGAEIDFKLVDSENIIRVFTTRPDTLYGATFMVLAPEHPLVEQITVEAEKAKVEAYVAEAEKKSDIDRMNESREKTGVFTGAFAVNPVSGEQIPIWIADYVLPGYGTGAIMAVPAHDERDYEFAKKFELPVINVVDPVSIREDAADKTDFVEKNKIVAVVENQKGELLTVNWGAELGGRLFVGGTVEADEKPEATAIREVTEETGYTDLEVLAVGDEVYHYKYFAFSKQEAHATDARFIHLRLNSDAIQAQNLDESEKDNFTVEWVSKQRAEREIVEPLHRYAFDKFILDKQFHGEGVLTNSGKYNGMPSSEAREKIVANLVDQNIGKVMVNYRMRDWLVSRQRYWGAPIPIIHCEKDGAVAVPDDQLPVELPSVENYEPRGDGKSVLAHVPEWYNVKCPKCGGDAVRETDTLDGYVCSTWYLFRYADANNDQKAWDIDKANYWCPLDFYCGGDHAVAHLLYVRFWTRFFRKQGLLNFDEPVKRLVYNGYINAADGSKMSKSKGNVVDPLELIEQGYGADALRVYELFIGPYEFDATWDPKGIAGSYRFLNRVWTLVQEFVEADKAEGPADNNVAVAAHRAIRKVSEDLERLSFNTAVAAMMEYVNELYKLKTQGFADRGAWQFALTSLVQLLQPFAPHLSSELWQALGHEGMIHDGGWPEWDDNYLVTDTITIVVQVNGKLRAELQLSADVTEEQAVEAAKENDNVKAYLSTEPKKVIYVPGRLVNFVV